MPTTLQMVLLTQNIFCLETLLHFGAGADVAGLWLHDIHKKTLEEILLEYPRLNFKEGMVKLINDQIKNKPNSYMATMVELGFLKKVTNAPFNS